MALDASSDPTHPTSAHRITWFSSVERPVGGTIFVKPVVEPGSDERLRSTDVED